MCSALALGQTLTKLTHQPPDGAGIGFLLTDGTVLYQGNGESDFWKLTPDNTGSYKNGTWSQMASLPSGYVPDAFASAVLADGRVLIEGGEYNNGAFALTNQGAIYDPAANTWTTVNPPSSWGYIGDSPACVLPNGKFLIGRKLDKQVGQLDPTTMRWTLLSYQGKSDFNAEEGWTLMPDGTILTFDVKNSPNSEKYDPVAHKWTTEGSTVANLRSTYHGGGLCYGPGCKLIYHPPGEVGPAILRPDGTVFATGATPDGENHGHTSVFTPSTTGGVGTWTPGPDFPTNDDAGDSFAALLPNGNVLVLGNSTTLYEYNGTTLTAGPKFSGSLLVLPTGEVLVGGSELYTTSGTYQSSWQPTISTFPSSVTRGTTYSISGTQFNGLSQAAAFGDEFETATNYPLVRITNNSTGHVYYAKTHGHSTMGVATGTAIVSTNFDVPAGMETGASSLVVVANGIPSNAVSITVN
jgi:hypothetical protein